MPSTAPAGIDEQRLEVWLADHVPGVMPPFAYELITGGNSNLTYKVSDAASHRYVLRRPPLGHLLATAHDVAREYRIVAALASTTVPVPPALAVCEDSGVNGAPFAVTGFVDGTVIDRPEKATPLDTTARHEASMHLIDVLADLHGVELDAVGLSGLSRHDGYLERQLRRWSKQWAASRTRELPIIDDVEERLREKRPEQRGVTIVHGDYRFGNCLVDMKARRVSAVLDWELCTLGDPLADLGHLGIYWHDPARPLALSNDPTSGGGFPPFGELLERYGARTGRDVSKIEYYRAFAAWRLAIIGEGVASRYLEHHPDDVAALRASQVVVERLGAFALASLGGG